MKSEDRINIPGAEMPSANETCARPMSVVHVIDGLAKSHGGPSYSVPATARALADIGVAVTLRTLGQVDNFIEPTSGLKHAEYERARGIIGRHVHASRGLRMALEADAIEGALLHTHGLWLMPNVYPAWARKRSADASRLVHSPRGMLSPAALRISAWKKLPFWIAFQRSALRTADCIHATALSEYEEIRAVGLANPVAVIPNAVDLPDLTNYPTSPGPIRQVLSLGRLHPKKGLGDLVHAWSLLEADFPDWRLRIAGPSERGYDQYLIRLIESLGLKHVNIEGPLYGSAKTEAYRSADIFVLASLNENFGLTVAEALAAELPVISTKGAPWQGLATNHCGWWIDKDIGSLAAAMRHAMSLSVGERRAFGARGRTWVGRDFSWNTVAMRFHDLYQWLREGGAPPATVLLD